MATVRDKIKLAVVAREAQEEHLWKMQSQNTSVPGINQDNIPGFQKRKKAVLLENCPRQSAGQKVAFRVLYLN